MHYIDAFGAILLSFKSFPSLVPQIRIHARQFWVIPAELDSIHANGIQPSVPKSACVNCEVTPLSIYEISMYALTLP